MGYFRTDKPKPFVPRPDSLRIMLEAAVRRLENESVELADDRLQEAVEQVNLLADSFRDQRGG
jgi:hypothetical protein